MWGCCPSAEPGMGCPHPLSAGRICFVHGLRETETVKSLRAGEGSYSPLTSRCVLWMWQRGSSFSCGDSL